MNEHDSILAFVDDLGVRLRDAAATIREMRNDHEVGSPERARLSGKYEGLRLAESYLADARHIAARRRIEARS